MSKLPPPMRGLCAALESTRFQNGVDRGHWKLASFDWPFGVFAVSSARRDGAPDEYALRIDFSSYPRQAPTATPWSRDRNDRLLLNERPKGDRASHVFRTDWEEGRALYAPWDRVALDGHPDWSQEHPAFVWHPSRDAAFFLSCVYELLNADDYLGV